MSDDLRQQLLDEMSALLAECAAQEADLDAWRLRTLGQMPSAKEALQTQEKRVHDAERAYVAADRAAQRARDDALDKAIRTEFLDVQAADLARQQFDPDRAFENARQEADTAYAARLRELEYAGGTLPALEKERRKARDARDAVYAQSELDRDRAIEKADADRARAVDAAAIKHVAAEAAANDQYELQRHANRRTFDEALQKADEDLADALSRNAATLAVDRRYRQRLAELREACERRKDAINQKLRSSV